MTRRFLAAIATLIVVGGSVLQAQPADWLAWQARRTEAIGGTNGWTTLIGLHWLKEGDNTAGSGPSSQVVLRSDHLPASIGVFTRKGKAVFFTAAEGTDVRVDGASVGKVELKTDALPNPTRLQIGLVSMIAIERGDRIGLRVRDPDSPARREFKGLSCFPYDPAWRLAGRFVPFPLERKLRVPDVTGNTQSLDSPGSVVFTAQGKEHRLELVQEPGEPEFLVLFSDQTAGDSTYGAGRFLHVAKPGSDNNVVLDFNRAYTPPCGFTEFATCPLPPKQNWLPLAVRAGELKPVGRNH